MWQPDSRAARKWRENEKMKRKWRENEEMEKDKEVDNIDSKTVIKRLHEI